LSTIFAAFFSLFAFVFAVFAVFAESAEFFFAFAILLYPFLSRIKNLISIGMRPIICPPCARPYSALDLSLRRDRLPA
jgi:hypothetical protein